MRKLAVFGGFLGLVVAAAVVALTDPWVGEKVLQWRCPQATPECQIRMRALAHMWSGKENWERARYWYARPAEAGDAASMFHMGWLEERDVEGVIGSTTRLTPRFPEMAPPPEKIEAVKKLTLAFDWYRRSAEKGYAPAMNNLGQLYFHGRGTSRDLGEAFRWHMRAANAGNPIGAMNVSFAYRVGAGVLRDPAEAEKWSRWTAKPDAPGLTEPTLGRTHLLGMTLPADRRTLVRAAAKQGVPVGLQVKPLTPSPEIPTFASVRKKLESPGAE